MRKSFVWFVLDTAAIVLFYLLAGAVAILLPQLNGH